MKVLLIGSETVEEFPKIYEEYKEAYKNRKNIINNLYDEIAKVKIACLIFKNLRTKLVPKFFLILKSKAYSQGIINFIYYFFVSYMTYFFF